MTETRPVLMVVDAQNGFVNSGSEHVIPVIAGLVRRWQAVGAPVIFTQYHNQPGSAFERLIGWRDLHTAPETDLVDELTPFLGHPLAHVISKTTYTALGEDVRQILAGYGATDLLLCGIATDGCVLKTALDAFESDITPWVIADACASNATRMDPGEAHRAALMLLSRLIGAGQIITAAEAAEWCAPAALHAAGRAPVS